MVALGKSLGNTDRVSVPHDVRESDRGFCAALVGGYWRSAPDDSLGWLVSSSKFYDWRERYGRVNEHNGWVPRDFG